jgi:Protein of unknown function (DUF2752)
MTTIQANTTGSATGARWRRLAGPAAAAVSVGAATLLLAVVDPNQSGHYPTCPLKFLTGLDCPGCGGLRSVHALATGHPVQALDNNALAVCLFPMVIFLWAVWARRSWTGDHRRASVPPRLLYAIYAVGILFAVVRNLPFVPFLRSGIG